MQCEQEMGQSDLIGVHCTHGLNRTGYFIVYYLIEQHKMSVEDAIKLFDESRKPDMFAKPVLIDDLVMKF